MLFEQEVWQTLFYSARVHRGICCSGQRGEYGDTECTGGGRCGGDTERTGGGHCGGDTECTGRGRCSGDTERTGGGRCGAQVGGAWTGRVWKSSLKSTRPARGRGSGASAWAGRPAGVGQASAPMASRDHAHVLIAAAALKSVLPETETEPNLLYFAG